MSASRTRVVFGAGRLAELGDVVRGERVARVLLVTDPGIVRAGHVDRAVAALVRAGVHVAVFDGVQENPTTHHVDAAVDAARSHRADGLVGLGGGSAMDCAKGANFILTNGGTMADYWGRNKATRPMLPMIAVPTTAGTGSEAQCFALIADPVTHQKMACGDDKAACRVAVLDPDLTATQPPRVAAAAGIDAITHTVETAATTARNETSITFSREAWYRLAPTLVHAIRNPTDAGARARMLLGAHLAGCAIEHAMLGAAHACANPLTARFGITHGIAVGVMLPHVVRYNARLDTPGEPTAGAENPYAALEPDAGALVARLDSMLDAADMPQSLSALNIDEDALPELATDAAAQWTARFNPRPVDRNALLRLYRRAFASR
ncbi:MAG: iron-containing alcohol dehydrogenase [Phycisphaerae bacterium]